MGIRKTIDQKIGQVGSDFSRDTINSELDLIHDRLNLTITRGDIFIARKYVESTYIINGDDCYLGVNTIVGPVTLALPASSDAIPNRIYIIKDETNNAGTNNITVTTADGKQIDKSASKTISTNSGVLRVFFTGLEWFTL